MNILVINCGSSSLKYQLINMDTEEVIAKGLCERIGIDGSKLTHQAAGKDKHIIENPMPSHNEAIKMVLDALIDSEHGVIKSLDEIHAVGHRVVHGGMKYSESVLVDADVKQGIRDCFDLGPLHNPANLMGIEAVEKVMPSVKNAVVFDTAFGASVPDKASRYAIPHEYYEKYSIKRYGFHGTSHKFVSGEAIKFGNLDPKTAKVIVCHLGNGASVSASIGGKCVDTSMGFTPLAGVTMGTRSGDIDASLVAFLMNKLNITDVNEMVDILNKKSGLLGISGVSSDMRDVEAASKTNEDAKVAVEIFVDRVQKYIGQYVAVMNGVDAIVFTAGIGENSKSIRSRIINGLTWFGCDIDPERNDTRSEAIISSEGAKVTVLNIPTNEEVEIARDIERLRK